MRVSFLGAADTVTGSRYLIDAESGSRLLVDCGLFQGLKRLRLRNREPFPVPPSTIDAVVLTHAHLDHVGYLPVLVRDGFTGPIYATPPTIDLAAIILRDAARLQEEDADYANRRGYTKHAPALPLFTTADAENALRQFEPMPYATEREVTRGITASLVPNGHIPGSASVILHADGCRTVMSGDLGRAGDWFMRPGGHPGHADYVVMESTYGGRTHSTEDPADQLSRIIAETASRGGTIAIPSFAVGRAQAVLIEIDRLRRAGRIPQLPLFLDSPMAASVADVIAKHVTELRVEPAEWRAVMANVSISTTVEESKAIARRSGPAIIVAGSGMATGGRIIHHLRRLLPDHRHAIAFTGFQAAGTRGEALVRGAATVRIHGIDVPVRAQIHLIDGFSAHADEGQLVEWLTGLTVAPRGVFLTHGEPLAADELRKKIERRLRLPCTIPEHLESVELEPVPRAAPGDRSTRTPPAVTVEVTVP